MKLKLVALLTMVLLVFNNTSHAQSIVCGAFSWRGLGAQGLEIGAIQERAEASRSGLRGQDLEALALGPRPRGIGRLGDNLVTV